MSFTDAEREGVIYINKYSGSHHDGKLHCSLTEDKGRVLHSTRSFKAGDVIFEEPPLHIVAEEPGGKDFTALKEACQDEKHNQVFDYEPLWYWTALRSLTKQDLMNSQASWEPISADQQYRLLLLYHPEVTEASEAVKTLIEMFKLHIEDPILLERLLQVWILNCFEHSESPLGYSTYFMSSFMSHSCFPNAVWHYEEDNFVLRARRDIPEGAEICLSYLSEDALLEPVPQRRKHLQDSKHFWCGCERCMVLQDTSRGFRCPKCKTGRVFSGVLEAKAAKTNKKDKIELDGVVCSDCSHQLTASEVKSIKQNEQEHEKLVERWDREHQRNGRIDKNAAKDAKKILGELDAVYAQHHICDRIWAHLVDFYEELPGNQQNVMVQKLVQKRVDFQKRSYPGLSGAYAWTLESQGDLLLRHFEIDTSSDGDPLDADAAQKVRSVVSPIFKESLRVLQLMFGDKHEYSASVSQKLAALTELIQRSEGSEGSGGYS